jgi:hypothetical protein
MTNVTLSKHEYMWATEQGQRTQTTGYRVGGMPTGHEALINNFGAPNRQDWRVLRIDNNVSGERFGHFDSADAALEAVAGRLKNSVQ